MLRFRSALFTALLCLAGGASAAEKVDLLISNGTIYDGKGGAPYKGNIAVKAGRVVAIGATPGYSAAHEVDAKGLAVSPGFINVLSWANESLIHDGRGLSDTLQGVTLEIFGEGTSGGPLTPAIKEEMKKTQADIYYDITWTTFGEFLEFLEKKGITPNVASFVGAATIRENVVGYENRAATPAELAKMQDLVRQSMREGALGVGSSLIYAPGTYANTAELIAITKAAAESGGGYISHMRSEARQFLEALDELIAIARASGAHAEVYHLKAAGEANWPKMKQAIARIEAARKEGLSISADMYPYTAGATGLDAAMPTWVQEGGIDEWIKRLQDPQIRARVLKEMRTPSDDWESVYLAAGSPDRVITVGYKTEKLKQYTGKSIAEIAKLRGTSPEDTIIDLVIEDRTRVGTVYYMMSEDNVKLGLSQPWVSIGSDAESLAPEGLFLLSNPHPRAYGTFTRFLGHYVRDQKVTTLQDAIRRITRLPAENFKLKGRGCIDAGCYADIVIFDPATIADHATFPKPHQLSTGVSGVFVNGVQVVKDGSHTGAKPGKFVRGPGFKG